MMMSGGRVGRVGRNERSDVLAESEAGGLYIEKIKRENKVKREMPTMSREEITSGIQVSDCIFVLMNMAALE